MLGPFSSDHRVARAFTTEHFRRARTMSPVCTLREKGWVIQNEASTFYILDIQELESAYIAALFETSRSVISDREDAFLVGWRIALGGRCCAVSRLGVRLKN